MKMKKRKKKAKRAEEQKNIYINRRYSKSCKTGYYKHLDETINIF